MQHDIFIETFFSPPGKVFIIPYRNHPSLHHKTIKLTLKYETDNFAVKPRGGKYHN